VHFYFKIFLHFTIAIYNRVAQMVAKIYFEPMVEPYFHQDSYGYRPGKSAEDALGVTRRRCWKYDWVLEFDIKGLFDNIDHELLMKAVRTHTDNPWVILYIERWLKAPIKMPDGTVQARTKGVPQGALCSNLHKTPYAKKVKMQSKAL
jgi:RNA-directed DNA polymerase